MLPRLRFRLLLALLLIQCGCESSEIAEPTDLLVGLFTLSVSADGCETIPEAARARTYAAEIALAGEGAYVVTLSGATFVSDVVLPNNAIQVNCGAFGGRLDCNQFTASRGGDVIEVQLVPNDERHEFEFAGGGGMIVEQLAPRRVVEFRGLGEGRFESQTLNARIQGAVAYAPSWPGWSDAIRCSTTLRLTFTRRESA
jgi:hypothetical protein